MLLNGFVPIIAATCNLSVFVGGEHYSGADLYELLHFPLVLMNRLNQNRVCCFLIL